jgi:hypothetical protein
LAQGAASTLLLVVISYKFRLSVECNLEFEDSI